MITVNKADALVGLPVRYVLNPLSQFNSNSGLAVIEFSTIESAGSAVVHEKKIKYSQALTSFAYLYSIFLPR